MDVIVTHCDTCWLKLELVHLLVTLEIHLSLMEAVMSKTLCKGEPAGTNLVSVGLCCQFFVL